MKTKKVPKKLKLNKQTMSNLDGIEMTQLLGGATLTCPSLICTDMDTVCGDTCLPKCTAIETVCDILCIQP